jgi:hypothetical protein
MPDTFTQVLKLTKPQVGSSVDTWGPKYHSAMDAIDDLFTDPDNKILKLEHGGTGGNSQSSARTAMGLGALAVLNTVDTSRISDSSITNQKIADGAITASKVSSDVAFPSGTRMLFQQSTPPIGWTKDTTHNDKALRVVSGSVSSGGSASFSSTFANRSFSGSTGAQTVSGTVGTTALDVSQIPSHSHYVAGPGGGTEGSLSNANYLDFANSDSSNASYSLRGSSVASDRGFASYSGGGAGHTHTFSSNPHTHTFSGSLDVAVQYVDFIIATKN